jgi:hypothetical protein
MNKTQHLLQGKGSTGKPVDPKLQSSSILTDWTWMLSSSDGDDVLLW